MQQKEKFLVIIFHHIFLHLFTISLDIFRPFPGFKTVRLIPREKKNGERVIFCFADFENTYQTTLVINTLQVLIGLIIYLCRDIDLIEMIF
jgi:hypothetical protein